MSDDKNSLEYWIGGPVSKTEPEIDTTQSPSEGQIEVDGLKLNDDARAFALAQYGEAKEREIGYKGCLAQGYIQGWRDCASKGATLNANRESPPQGEEEKEEKVPKEREGDVEWETKASDACYEQGWSFFELNVFKAGARWAFNKTEKPVFIGGWTSSDPVPVTDMTDCESPKPEKFHFIHECRLNDDVVYCNPKTASRIAELEEEREGLHADLIGQVHTLGTKIEMQEKQIAELEVAYKNFHKRLCERFGYGHDETEWQRDQCSLEEHIAKRIAELEHKRQVSETFFNTEVEARHAIQKRLWNKYGFPEHYSLEEMISDIEEKLEKKQMGEK